MSHSSNFTATFSGSQLYLMFWGSARELCVHCAYAPKHGWIFSFASCRSTPATTINLELNQQKYSLARFQLPSSTSTLLFYICARSNVHASWRRRQITVLRLHSLCRMSRPSWWLTPDWMKQSGESHWELQFSSGSMIDPSVSAITHTSWGGIKRYDFYILGKNYVLPFPSRFTVH